MRFPSSPFVKGVFVSTLLVCAVIGLRSWEKRSAEAAGRGPSALASTGRGTRFDIRAFNLELSNAIRDSKVRAELVNLLLETYRPRVRKLARTIRTYHYGNRGPLSQDPFSQISPVPSGRGYFDAKRLGPGVESLEDPNAYRTPIELSPPEAALYFESKAGLLFGKGTSEGAAGPGLYAAVDPIQSEMYAGNPWFLLEIEAPGGTKYLEETDLYRVDREFFERFLKSEDLRAAFFARDDRTYWKIESNSYYVSKELLIDSPEIRSLLNEAVRKLEIDFILYPWTEVGLVHCAVNAPGGVAAQLAMNFVNPEFLERGGKLSVFVASLESNPPPAKAKRYRELLEIIELGYAKLWLPTPPVYSLEAQPTPSPTLPRDGEMVDFDSEYGYAAYSATPLLKKAVFLTYGWNEALGRTSAWVPEIVSEEHAKGISEFLNRHFHSQEAIPKGKIKVRGVEVRVRTSTSTSTSSAPSTYVQILGNLDTEKRLEQKLGAENLEGIFSRVRAQTFGCSKKYPEEYLHAITD